MGYKAMKTNLTNMLRGKERKKIKKRKNRYAKLNRGRWRRFIYIKEFQHLLSPDFFDDGHSDQCEVIPQCSLDLFYFSKVYLGLNPIKSGNVFFVI